MRVQSWQVGCAFLVAIGATNAAAQTTIYGMDLRNGQFYSSNTATFVASHTNIGANSDDIYALDFDAAAGTLWGIDNATMDYGTFDLSTGVFTALGTVTGPPSATGLTAAADGVTWYVSEYDGTTTNSSLWVGDVTTGTFTLVGTIVTANIMIDISIDSTGNLYGLSISDDALYSIDTTTGLGSKIGAGIGLNPNYAQGMDFDWTDDTLYATVYTGGGTGKFCSMDLTTGLANQLEDTFPLNAEMEMACQPGGVTPPGTPFCFGNTASGNPCPCGNDNDGSDPLGAGCAHDDSAAGARLEAIGVASITGDTLLFEGYRGPISNSSMFFQANNNQDGNGLFLGDGIRCAGGGLIRLKVKLTDASGYADSSPMVVTTRSASLGHTITAGETLYYQWWFRDSNGSPCTNESNTSNGYLITWAP